MRDSSRIAYAQARVQARFGQRPGEAFWRELEAGRDLPHLVEIVRGSRLGAATESLAPSLDGHALERRLRLRWRDACWEIASWYPETWRPAMAWLAWLPWLAPLAWLAHRPAALPWMKDDPLLGGLAGAEPGERPSLLGAGPWSPLQGEWNENGDLGEAWYRQWRRSWPTTDDSTRRGLERLANAVVGLGAGRSGPSLDVLVDVTEQAVTRVFRRHAGTPVAGLAMVVLLALDHLRLRAALAVARSFGQARAA